MTKKRKTPAKNTPTLNRWAREWLATYIQPVAKPGGYESYHDALFKHILPVLGDYRLDELTTPMVQRFFNELSQHGNLRDGGALSPKSVKNIRVVLDTCCKRAVANGLMQENPVLDTVIRRCATPHVDVMTETDLTRFEEWLFRVRSSENTGIALALFTGMRLGEICALRWRHYDAGTGTLHVQDSMRRTSTYNDNAVYGEKTRVVIASAKTDASCRNLYLQDFLQALLENQYRSYTRQFGVPPRPEDFILFNKAGNHLDPDNLSHYFVNSLKCLGLPHVKFHGLRHTFATRAVERGIDVATVSGILGHADVTTTTHFYVHPREEAMRRAMTAMRPGMGKATP